MPILKSSEAKSTTVKVDVIRRLVHTNNLMMVVIDFTNGPWSAPDPPHSHPHEQTTYVEAGEIIFFCEGEPDEKLSAGDMFWVPSNKSHAIQLLSKSATLVDSFNPIRKEFLS